MAVLIDSYADTNQNGNLALSGAATFNKVGQSFTGGDYKLTAIRFSLRKFGSPTGNVFAKLYAHTGTFGSTGTPTGSALATSDAFDISTLTTSNATYELEFSGSGQYLMSSGNKYFIVAEFTGGSGSNGLEWGIDISSATHGGNIAAFTTLGGTWGVQNTAWDGIFYVYGEEPISTLQGVSTIQGAQSITL